MDSPKPPEDRIEHVAFVFRIGRFNIAASDGAVVATLVIGAAFTAFVIYQIRRCYEVFNGVTQN